MFFGYIVDDAVDSSIKLAKGENVLVVGASLKRGHLIIEHGNSTFHVPHQYLELKSNCSIATNSSGVSI